MQLRDNVRPVDPGQQDPNLDTNFLTVVVIVMACFIAIGFLLFPRHDQSTAIGPGATATPNTGGGGPSAPSPVAPASPPGGPPSKNN